MFAGPLECAKFLVNRNDSLYAEMPVAHVGGWVSEGGGIFGESEVNK